MRKLHGIIGWVGIFFCFILAPVSGFAAFEIHPRLTLVEEYNDNINLDSEDEEDDFITTVAPGILLNYIAKELLLDVDYSLRFRKYASNTDEDETAFKDIQRGLATAELFPDRNFTISLLGESSRVAIDESDAVADDDGSENRTNLYRFIFNPQYRFRNIPTYEVVFDYLFENLYYTASEGNDSVSNQAGVSVVKNFSRRLTSALSYRFEDFNGDETENVEGDLVSEDYQRHDAFATVTYELSPQWTVSGRGGPAWIDFDERSSTNSVVWGGRIEYNPSYLFFATLDYTQDFESTVDDGLVKSKRGNLQLGYLGKIPVTLGLYRTDDTYEETDREDKSTGGVLTVTFPFTTRLSLLLSGDYAYSEYTEDDEDVDDYGARASLEYVTRYVTFVLSQSFRERDSNLDDSDFTNNITSLAAFIEF